jgi:urocanate hydratase
MENPNTIDSILRWLHDKTEKGEPISPSVYLEKASNLNTLLEELDEDWVKAKMNCSMILATYVSTGNSVASARVLMEASEERMALLRLEAKRERVKEHIRIAKKRSELKNWE